MKNSSTLSWVGFKSEGSERSTVLLSSTGETREEREGTELSPKAEVSEDDTSPNLISKDSH